MWTTRLLILGLVRWLQPVHGYDVHRELMSWGVMDWAGVKRGSIYHALKKLSADGLLEVVSTEQVDNRPARTTYQMTRTGEEEFHSLLREKLWNTECLSDDFWIAWTFIPVLSYRETAALLRDRADRLRDRYANTDKILASRSDDPRDPDFMPEHVRRSLSLTAEKIQLDIAWCEETAVLVEAGQVYPANVHDGPPDGAEQWKQHIDTLDARGRPRQ
jgi:DNA-binding PadR family transcriptional regulator